MIYQSGYFTTNGYNRETNRYRLDFPNEEVREGFVDVLAPTTSRDAYAQTHG